MTHINIDQLKSSFAELTESQMLEQWSRLHAGDQEPKPSTPEMTAGWLHFHNGDYLIAEEIGASQSAGKSLQLKALSTYAHYLEADSSRKIERFQEAVRLAEEALVIGEGDKANIYYQLAYALGRYGQFISIAKALSEGIAGKIEKALRECLALIPNHADAHTALATYQAEVIGKLGKMAAKLTYGAKPDDAEQLYRKGVTIAPYSVSAKTEYADGLLTMFGKKRLNDAVALYEQSVEHPPIDSLEALDTLLAKEELASA